MLTSVYCNGCGQRLEVPAGHAKSKLRCPECGVFSELPEEVRAQAQAAVTSRPAPARAPRPPESAPAEEAAYSFLDDGPPPAAAPPAPPAPAEDELLAADLDEPEEREVLIHGTEEDDFNPYTVTGDAPTKQCPACDRKSTLRAKLCSHCGYNFETQEKVKRTYQPLRREWEPGLPFDRRLAIFVAMQVVNFIVLVSSLLAGYGGLSVTLVLMMVGLQAFLCGTYQKLTLERTAKGKVTLATTWRYAFVPRPPQPVRWKEHDGVTIVTSNDFEPLDLCIALILLSYCIVPGVLFWWFVIRPDKFAVTLCKDHGYPETPIFRTTDEERAKEVMNVVSDVTTLPLQK